MTNVAPTSADRSEPPKIRGGPPSSRSPVVRRLPLRKDWPTYIIIAVQAGLFAGVITLWEIGARVGLISSFFWSQPSAIYQTAKLFFASRSCLSRHRLHLLSDHSGVRDRNHARIADWIVVLVVAQLYGCCPALHHMLREYAEARTRADNHFGIRHEGYHPKSRSATALTIVVSTLTAYAGVYKAVDRDGERLFYSF